ncbi:MAG: hypothetical protein DMG01_02735 [Acidobacteria bacterium]|nr:MAG: hypothetical protein DMG01_02735 [Acidobacteriota bacterium]
MSVLLNACLAVAILFGLSIVGRTARSWTWRPARIAAFLRSPWAPAALGLVTIIVVRFVWRSFGEPGVIHDERAYLLQAEIFARGRWTASPPPIAAFFEQMHVFVEPAVFAKYPPAHAMMLVPGIWLGMPGLMPALLAGIAGALTFWLARRLSNAWTALLTWMLWTTAPLTLVWATSYLSESTTTVMWLAAAAATVLWLESGKQIHLLGVAAALAWGFEARPLTMVALAAPLGFVILRKLIEIGTFRRAAVPLLAGIALLGVGLVWNQQTLGDWRTDPYSLYSRTYFPFDKPGFGIDPTPPLRPLPPELLPMDAWSREVHEVYGPSAVPVAFAERVLALLAMYSFGWRFAIGALLVGSLIRARGPARFALVASASLFIAYLAFAHPPGWVVYYLELLPALHFLAAIGLMRLLGQSSESALDATVDLSAAVARSSALAAALLLPLCLTDLWRVRAAIDVRNAFHRRAEEVIRAAPSNSIVFVRYAPSDNPHLAVTRNEADLASARAWVVYDRGADDKRLLALAPDRKPYVLEPSTFRLTPLVLPQE